MERVIKLEISARRKRALLLNDLIPAAVLLFTGLISVRDSGMTVLAATNIVSGGLLVTFGIREWRSLGRHSEGRIQWYDLVSGIVVALDAATMYKPWKGFQPADLYAVLAAVLILRGFGVIKSSQPFHRLTISESGFKLRVGLFSRRFFTWEDVEGISRTGHQLRIATKSGVSEVSLRRISHPEEVEESLVAYHETLRSRLPPA